MTDMNQSFIRAFAKKEAATKVSVSEKRSARKAAPLLPRSANESDAAIPAASIDAVAPPWANLLASESVMVLSASPMMESGWGGIAAPVVGMPWTEEAAHAAQAVVTNVPREVAAKSAIPAPPKPMSKAPIASTSPGPATSPGVQRIDSSHRPEAILPKIDPAWEVDQLDWPRTCEQLLTAENAYFEEASHRLVEASKQGMRTLAICGSRRGEGCSTIALCIARSAARKGLRIGLLDADILGDGLAEFLGLDVQCNWLDISSRSDNLNEHAVLVNQLSITLLPLTRSAKRTQSSIAESLAHIPAIAQQFDLLIVDFGALSEGAFGKALKSKVELDAALVVRDLRHTSSRDVQSTVNFIRSSGIEAVGIAENFGAR